jgi:hypothetical protein
MKLGRKVSPLKQNPVANALAAALVLSLPQATEAAGGADTTVPPVAPSSSPATGKDSAAADAAFQKPAWLMDLSVGAREGYDNNVFLSGVDQKYVPAGASTLENRGSWVTIVSPKVAVNAVPLLGSQEWLQALSLSYAPDFISYHDQSTESYTAHRAAAALKGSVGAFSFNAEDSFVYVNGSQTGPAYPGSLLNAWSTINVKDRREQIQDRAKLSFQYDWQKWFIRPTAALIYFDMKTALLNPALATTPSGYQNYEDRNDVNGGADLGYKVLPKLAVTLGYRYGHQYQQQFAWDLHSSSSDYQRVLLGIEGQLCKGLKVQLQGGPDFRCYDPDTATHIAPVDDHHPVTYYGEALVTATLTTNDMLTFKYKQWEFVSACGRVPYFDSSYDISWQHKFNRQFSLDLGGRILGADYTSGNLGASSLRNDYDYILAATAHYAFNAHVGADLGYSADFGRNAQDNIANSSTRDFQRQVVSLGLQFKL